MSPPSSPAAASPPGPATALIRSGAPQGLRGVSPRPAERYLLTAEAWSRLPAALDAESDLALLALWAERGPLVHVALLDETTAELGALLLVSAPASGGRYAALSPARPGARRFERMIRDLWGLEAEGAEDRRPWLDHGRWRVLTPLAAPRAVPRPPGPPPQPEFLPAESEEGLHQYPLGPIRGDIAQAAHFRFHLLGERVVRLEERLGYTHKGTLSLILGKSPRAAARFAARLSGDSTVAHGWAFAMAAEAATGTAPPPRAVHLRAVMAELERIRAHLDGWGAVCAAAGFHLPRARCGVLREGVLRAADQAFGHRLMMDRVLPGGIAIDIAPSGLAAILAALEPIAAEIPALARLCERHTGLQERLSGAGPLAPALAARFAADGFVGRASGRGFDARQGDAPYAPYDALGVAVPLLDAGDVAARLAVRIAELAESVRLVRTLLATLPAGETLVPLPHGGGGRGAAGEGIGLVEGFRGACLHWLRLDDGGLIQGAMLRDPSWMQWPLLEAAVTAGQGIGDFALCERSFHCSSSGADL